jgi:hypothetical protein
MTVGIGHVKFGIYTGWILPYFSEKHQKTNLLFSTSVRVGIHGGTHRCHQPIQCVLLWGLWFWLAVLRSLMGTSTLGIWCGRITS